MAAVMKKVMKAAQGYDGTEDQEEPRHTVAGDQKKIPGAPSSSGALASFCDVAHLSLVDHCELTVVR